MRPVFALLLAAALAGPAAAQAPADPGAAIDRVFAWATPATPGCAVAVSHGGRVVASRAYGSADLARGVPLTPASVFDIGSVQKQFVAAAVLLLAQEGRLALSDDIRRHLPELPDYGHVVTVDHLLTHTGGVRDWTGMRGLAPEGTDVLSLIVRQRGLDFVPGEEWAYSNSGYVLLREIVSRAAGMPLAEVLRTRVFEPLGMRSSRYVNDMAEAVPGRALAYDREGDAWREHMYLGADRGGGALFSTAADLLAWNQALSEGRLGAFVTEALHAPAVLANGRRLPYARGLFVDTNEVGRVVWHTGGAAGYSTALGRYLDQGLSFAVLCNADGASSRGARGIGELFLPPAEEGAGASAGEARGGAPVEAARAGLFFREGDALPLRLAVAEGRLRVAGGPVLEAAGPDRFRTPRGDLFFLSGDAFELRFVSADTVELRSMEGRTTRYRRAAPFRPSAEELRAFAGRFASDEIGSVMVVSPGERGISVALEHAPERAMELAPADRDTFGRGMALMRFVRDAAGNVVALDYGNPALRRVRFTRVEGAGSR